MLMQLTMTWLGLSWRHEGVGGVLVLLLLILATNVDPVPAQTNEYTCPRPARISPCSCSVKKNGLDVLCESTEGIHIAMAMAELKRKPNSVIYYLKLRHNNLPKLREYVFLGLDIRHLTVHNSNLAVVEEAALSSLGKGLMQLDLSQNSLHAVPSTALRTLHHLLILNLNHNKIKAIPKDAFAGLDTLEILSVYENKITSIDPSAFHGLEKKLKRLNLGGNELMHIPKDALSTLETLKKLEMQENGISEIWIGELGAGLKNLDSLNLQHNYLYQVPARVFSNLTMLNSLELENNYIKYIDPEAFVGLESNLQYLRLGDNKLDSIPSKALSRLHRLRHLDLRANNITSIADDAFKGFGDSITFLNLQKNGIRVLPVNLFEDLNSLETINLQNNMIASIGEDMMEPILDTLKYIYIYDNPLICTCDLTWYEWWYNKRMVAPNPDDKTPYRDTWCYSRENHHEYNLLGLGKKLGCLDENQIPTSRSTTNTSARPIVVLIATLLLFSFHY